MTDDRIKQLLAEGEGLTIEYKECVNDLSKSVWETVCSFQNRYGGHLILGAEDDGIDIPTNEYRLTTVENYLDTQDFYIDMTWGDVQARPAAPTTPMFDYSDPDEVVLNGVDSTMEYRIAYSSGPWQTCTNGMTFDYPKQRK